MPDLLILTIVSVPTIIIFSVIFKGKSKVDKGFELNYFKLSYRRKMIRTLITSPIFVLAIIMIYLSKELSELAKLLLGLFFFVIFAIQLIYNFYMWKKKES